MKKIFTLFAALACVMSMSAVTYNVTVPAGTKACYIAGEMNSWSFTEMTKVDDTHYTVTLAEATEAMGYKYCSGPGWAYVEKTEGGEEIGNRVYAVKDVVAKWASVYDPGNAPTPGEAKDITIKAKVPATWTNTITAWVWPTGSAGKEVTPAKEGEWYVYTEKCSELNIIFKNGTGWNGDINQTVDITISESTCVEITAGTGKATYTTVDCEDNPGEEPGDDPVVTPDPETGVTYNVTVPAGTKACYIAGEMNGWSQQEMTKVDETHYTITIATATTAMKYKYCSGPSWDYVEMQADGTTDVQDRTYSANDVVESWKAVYNPNGSENPDPNPEPKDIMVKAKMPSHWTETITAWVWETGNEGEVVVPTKDNDWYVVSAHCSALNVIFRNGTDWSTKSNQTEDITLLESACIQIDQIDTLLATYTQIDCEGSILPSDTIEVYTIAGVTSLVGVNWDPTATINDMTKQEDGTYTLLKENLKLVADMPYEYKVVKNHAWDIWSLPGWNMGNDTLLVEKSGLYDVTFTLNLVDTILTAVAHLKEELVLVPVVQLAGNMTDWAENAIEMTLSTDSLSASTTISLLADSLYTFKVIVDGNWKGYNGMITRVNSTDLVFNSEVNCELLTDVAGEYTITWVFATSSVSVVYPENNIPLPEPKDIAVKAKMPSHWTETITAWVWETGKEGEVVIPTKDDDWYVVSARCSALNVIFRNGTDWNGDANQTVNITLMDSACIVLSQSDTTKATYTIVDCETSEPLPEPKGVTYSVTVPAGTNACYIAGEMNNWSHIEMTKVDDTHYTLTVDTATASMKYKYCSGPSWDYVEMQADGATDVQDRTYAENDVVEAWKAVYNPGGENPGEDPVTPTAYYITGNDVLFGANAWKSDAIAMTEAEGVYTHTFTAVAAGVECQFKITDGTWNNSWGFSNLTTTPAGVTGNNDNNIIFTLAETGDVVVSFSAEKITITGNFAGSSVDPAQITYVLMGVQGDWTTGIELTKNETAEWEEYMLLGQTISEGDSVKVVRLEAGVAKHWCGNVKEGVSVTITPDDKNGNIILAPGTYDFYYDVVADAIWIAEAAQSAIDNVVLANKATKIIRNGQMYIIRDEVMFNVLGQVVE